jgi:hypothetical protein
MDWLKHRFSTAIEAFTAKRAFVIGSIFAVATLVAKYAPSIPWRGHPVLLGTPAWTWGVMTALVMTIYFIFEYAHRKRMELVPKFDLTFDSDKGGIVFTPTKVTRIVNGIIEHIDSHGAYIRVRVDNESATAIKECFAFITSIEKKDKQTGAFVPVPLPYAIPLASGPITIYSKIPNFIDFLKVGELENVPEPSGQWPLTLQRAFQEETSYVFETSVVANGLTKAKKVEVIWSGQWDKISAKPRD